MTMVLYLGSCILQRIYIQKHINVSMLGGETLQVGHGYFEVIRWQGFASN